MNIFSKNNIKNIKAFGIFPLVLITMVACESHDGQKIDGQSTSLVWSDEFNGAVGAQPDAANWTYDIGRGDNGWGNNELQYYTNRTENIAMDGEGSLVITAIKENYLGAAYTSARIITKGLREKAYGRFEARIQTPYGQGLWPAFWMLGDNFDTAGWPQCGEIDIMEVLGQAPSTMNSALHGPGYSGGNALLYPFRLIDGRFDVGFHIFAVEWSESKLDFYVDGYMFKRVLKSDVEAKGQWVYDHPFFLLLNVAVGGNYPGSPDTSTVFPQTMKIDYVRVYQ